MNDPLKGLHARDGTLVEKFNIYHFLSHLPHFNGNLKLRCNSEFVSNK